MRWWKRQNIQAPRWLLRKYEEQAEAHRQAAILAQKVRSESAGAHQIALKDRYEREARKLRRKIPKRERSNYG
jgi:hypothetical protein